MRNKTILTSLMIASLAFLITACTKQEETAKPGETQSSQEAGQATADGPADFVFTNGKVYTVNPDQPWAEAVAVKGNKIVYVGDAAGAEAFVDDGTEGIDLTGKMMLPGYISTHDHIIAAAWVNQGVDLNSATSKEETLQMLRDYVEANPDLPMILGQGYNTG